MLLDLLQKPIAEDLEDNDTLRRLIPKFIAGGILVINDASTAEVSPLRAEYFARYGVKVSLAVPIEVSGRYQDD